MLDRLRCSHGSPPAVFAFLLSPVLLAACSESATDPPTDPPRPPVVATVVISLPTGTLVEGDTLPLTAEARDSAGALITGRSVAWSSSDTTIAVVTQAGLVTARWPGSVLISAVVDGRRGEAALTVSAARIATLEMSLDSGLIATGDTLVLTATPRDSAGRALAGRTIAWTSAAPSVASVENGRVIGTAAGRTTVRASVGGVSASLPLEIFVGSGLRAAALEGVDRAVLAHMRQFDVPGAALAVMRDGRLVYARGYGYADRSTGRTVEPDNLFRIGSVSKPVTAIAALKLVQDGKLSLDNRPFAMLSNLPALPGETEDPRLAAVTLRQLMNQTAGWHVDRTVDYRVWEGVWRDGVRDPQLLFRYGRGVPLATDPGTAFAYTNYAANVVARAMEHIAGVPYETYVRTHILEPIGIRGMKFGNGALANRDPDEVRYYNLDGTPADADDGAMESWDAAGRWIASAPDMMRLLAAVEGKGGLPAILRPETIASMTARPDYVAPGAAFYYGMFWYVIVEAGGLTWTHAGAPAGGFADLHRLAEGTSYVMLWNRANSIPNLVSDLRAVVAWPDRDLFPLFY